MLRNACYVLVVGLSMMRDSESPRNQPRARSSTTTEHPPSNPPRANTTRICRSSTGGSPRRSPRPWSSPSSCPNTDDRLFPPLLRQDRRRRPQPPDARRLHRPRQHDQRTDRAAADPDRQDPTPHVPANDGDADRPVPRQRDRAGHPAQTHRLPSVGQPLDPGLRQRRQLLGRAPGVRDRRSPVPSTRGPLPSPQGRRTDRLRPRRRADGARPSTTFSTQSKLEVATQPSNEPCSAKLASPSDSASSTTVSWTRTTPSARPASKTPSSPKATRDRYRIGAVPTDAPTASSAPNTYRSGPQSGAPCSPSSTRQDCRPAAKKRCSANWATSKPFFDKTATDKEHA